MSSRKTIYSYLIAAGIAGLLLSVLRADKGNKKKPGKRGKGSVLLEVAHDIGEGVQEELIGLKNRVFN